MRQIYTFILLLGCITGIYSQQSNHPMIDQGHMVVVDLSPENEFFYTHTFEKGHTVYSLARIFGVANTKIYQANRLSSQTPIGIGQTVKVPLNVNHLITTFSSSIDIQRIPVYYYAKPKETLYRIAKVYLNQDINRFAQRNQLKSTDISVGQRFLIGWLRSDDNSATALSLAKDHSLHRADIVTPEQLDVTTDQVVPQPSQIIEDIESAETTTEVEMDTDSTTIAADMDDTPVVYEKERGIAIWDRNSKVNTMSVALHATAKRNTIIVLTNPQMGLTTTARVIGPIPPNTYTDDVTVIVSKKVAESIGALDTRFMVDLTYQEDPNLMASE